MLKRIFFLFTVLSFSSMNVTADEPQDWSYSMRSGESVWSIAHELLTDWRDWQTIERLNGVTNDRHMTPGTVLKIPRDLINEYQSDIQILDVAGTVTAEVLMKDGSVKAHLPLSRNQSLGQGDLLRTAEQSTVLLGFDDSTQVLILENSILKVERATVIGNKRKVVDIKVFLEKGEAEVRANPSKVPGSNFLIETPVAFATTRGTTYRVRAQGDQTAAEVTQGLIGVGNNLGSTGVRQGFGTLTKKDEPPMKPKKLLQAPGLPDLSATIRYLPGRLSWDQLDGAVHYRSQISPDEAFTSIIYDKVSSHPKMGLPATLQDQSYWLRVSAVSDEGLQGFASTAKINIDARPFPPVRQAPRPSDSIYAGPLDFAWSRPETAEKFEIQIASDEEFKALVMQQVVEDTKFSTEITEPGGYFWRVTSIAEDGEVGPLGHVGKFTVKPVPPKPEMKEPVSTEHEIFFSWQEEQDVKKYQFQFAKDKEFKQLVVDQETENSELAIDKPEAGTYYMRVRAFDADDYAGEWAAPQEVEQPVENWWPLIFTATISVLLML